MSRSRTIERKRQTHQRITARLIALAVLCERAAGMPAFIRFMVLWMLRSGEVAARDYAGGLADDAGYQLYLPAQPNWQSSGSEDAKRLAQQFRVLADILQFLSVYVGLEAADAVQAHAFIHRSVIGCSAFALIRSPRPVAASLSSARGPPMVLRDIWPYPRWRSAPALFVLLQWPSGFNSPASMRKGSTLPGSGSGQTA